MDTLVDAATRLLVVITCFPTMLAIMLGGLYVFFRIPNGTKELR